MSYSYHDKLRRILLDMHIEDWNPEFLSRYSPEELFKSLKIANINAPMLYLNSHVGLCYWPTKTGEMHKAFIGKEDATKRLFNLCHAEGMAVVAYYSLIFNNWAYREHPEWRMVDIYGHGYREKGKRYGLCCPNDMEYREFNRRQMAEFCDYLDFEGIFLDMTYWPMICYCDDCRARWEKEVGGDMPTVIDWNDERWNLFQKKREDWLEEFALDMTSAIKKHKPDCAVEHQYSTILDIWRRGTTSSIAKASDFAGGDLYGGFAEQSFACKLYYNVTRNQPFEYMTSRCYPGLNEHTTNKSIEQLRTSVLLTAMHHGACLLIDGIDPRGTHDRRVYEKMGVAFREMEKYEKYLSKGKQAYDVGVYFTISNKINIEHNNIKVGEPGECNLQFPHLESSLGAAESLRKHHIPYTVLSNWKLDLLKDAKVLVLSDVPRMSTEEIDAVREYVYNGGKLYMSGHSALELVEEFFGGKIEGLTAEDITYMAPCDGTNWALGEFTKDYPMIMFDRSMKLKAPKNGTVLGTLTLPYTVPNPISDFTKIVVFDRDDPVIEPNDPRYKFASIHSNPPGIATDYPALMQVNVGSGTVIWSCVPFEKAKRYQHSDIFSSIIRSMIECKPVFSSNAPDVVEFVAFDAPEFKQKYIGMINLQDDFHPLPVYNFDLCIASDVKPVQVLKADDDTPVEFTYSEGIVKVHIDVLSCFEMFVLFY